ncbi:MAG: DUF1570 domain-containing protein [Planctomycetota bacterium]|nr:MAG: DUF1570 domain-containing protein [Planctomycetota bacterium]
MKTRILILTILALFVSLLIVLPMPGYADTIVRRDGRQIEGKIIEENEDYVLIETKYGEVIVLRAYIEKVIREGGEESPGESEQPESGEEKKPETPKEASRETLGSEYVRRLAEAAKEDSSDAFYELGLWCRKMGMDREAKGAFEKATDINPNHKDARRELGQVLVGKNWMSKEEAIEQGYTRDENGNWVKKSKEQDDKERKRLERLRKEAEKLREEKRIGEEGVPWEQRHILKSGHYTLECNCSKEIANMYLRTLEALYKKYMKIFAALNPKQKKCRVQIRRNHQEFMQAYRKPAGVGGFYGGGSLCAYHGRFGITGSTVTVLAHEGCHQFQDMFAKRGMFSMPIWVLEGMAVIFESAEIDPRKGTVDLVGLNTDRVRNLQSMMKGNRHVTLKQMLVTPQSSFRGSHYCTAGAFTWWLLKASKKKKYKFLYERYLVKLVEGKSRVQRGEFEKMAQEITGKTFDELAAEWREYVMKIEIPKFGVMAGNRFISKTLRFEVTRPTKTWKEVDESELGSGYAMSWRNQKAAAAFSVLYVKASGASADMELQKFEKDVKENADIQDFSLLNKKKTFVAEYEAAEFLYECRNAKSKVSTNLMKKRRVVVITPKVTYYIVAECESELWKKYEKDFKKMINSFKLDW